MIEAPNADPGTEPLGRARALEARTDDHIKISETKKNIIKVSSLHF